MDLVHTEKAFTVLVRGEPLIGDFNIISFSHTVQIVIAVCVYHFYLHSFRFAQAQIGYEIASFVPSFTLFLCYTLLMQVHYRARGRK